MGSRSNNPTTEAYGIASSYGVAVSITDLTIVNLRQVVEQQHGGIATLAQTVPVREAFNGQTVRDGVLHVFDLKSA
jgi:hypothetical protein